MNLIYLDHASTTELDQEVLETMLPFMKGNTGNPSSIHTSGRQARKALEDAREQIADSLSCHPREIIFTSSATEANNLALFGAVRAIRAKDKRNHIVASSIEHHSVLYPCQKLLKEVFDVTYVKPDSSGIVNTKDVEAALTDKTCLVSVMSVNNEIGTIQPIEEISSITRHKGILFHTDAVQALGKTPLSLSESAFELASLSSHKIRGPKGIGALWIRRGVTLEPLIYGGPQEFEKRSGTENIAGAVGFAKAVRLSCDKLETNNATVKNLSDRLGRQILKQVPNAKIHGYSIERENKIPHILNIRFSGIDAESLVISLDQQGIMVSSGSACASLSTEPSHVLTAMGLNISDVKSSVRFSISHTNTAEEIDKTVELIERAVKKLL